MAAPRPASLAAEDTSADRDFDYVNMDAAGAHGEPPKTSIEHAENYLFGHNVPATTNKKSLRLPSLAEIRSTIADPLDIGLDHQRKEDDPEGKGRLSRLAADIQARFSRGFMEENGEGQDVNGSSGPMAVEGVSSHSGGQETRTRVKDSFLKFKESMAVRLRLRWKDEDQDTDCGYVDFDTLEKEIAPTERKTMPTSLGFRASMFAGSALRRKSEPAVRPTGSKNQVPLSVTKSGRVGGSYVPPTVPGLKTDERVEEVDGSGSSRAAQAPIVETKASEVKDEGGFECAEEGNDEGNRAREEQMDAFPSSKFTPTNTVDWAQRRRDGDQIRRDYDVDRLRWKKAEAEKRLRVLQLKAEEISRCAKALNQEIQILETELLAMDDELDHVKSEGQ